jgi:3-methyladenine DNA glycosylase AlkD
MKNTASRVEKALREQADPIKAAFFPRFFKTGKGEYGEGDTFLGVTVPKQRAVAKTYRQLDRKEIAHLLKNPFHECRLTGLFILVHQFQKGDENTQSEIVSLYLKHIDRVNNWDLVDATAHKIIGPYLEKRDRELLYTLAKTDHLWSQRIAVVATFHFIRLGQFHDTLRLAGLLMDHPHDLIHKSIGWMLREVGKRDMDLLEAFLKRHYAEMPRVMLRYAIERFPESLRKSYIRGEI